MKILVVTPTIGSPELVDALISVRAQTFRELENVQVVHVVMVDGAEYQYEVMNALTVAHASYTPEMYLDTRMTVWPFNTGGQGFYGHKLYAAASQMVTPDIDWVFFLDQDNWYEPDHIESLVLKAMRENLDFSFSLRKFYTYDAKFYANDNCASLGPWKAWEEELGGRNLVDTGCYCFRGSYISKWGHVWNMGWGADITFFELTMATARYATTGKRTFCYRLGTPWADKYEEEIRFIDKWNAHAKQRYGGKYPWEA
jgi:glycosyltransferase involved in cell wall biosynthesis